jgi:photoactive yellow protein
MNANLHGLFPEMTFDQPHLLESLLVADDAAFNALNFGVIAIDANGIAKRYNAHESKASGLNHDQVLDLHFFSIVAQCMNNFMVAQRFEDAKSNAEPLDATIDYVLSLRMRPIPVKLRLLSSPDAPMQYICIQR